MSKKELQKNGDVVIPKSLPSQDENSKKRVPDNKDDSSDDDVFYDTEDDPEEDADEDLNESVV